MINYYEILKLENFCDDQEKIKKNFKSLISQYHPDHGGDSITFQKIKDAYELLKDKNKKEKFDNDLIYYLEVLERSEVLKISLNSDNNYKCSQCEAKININIEDLNKNSINIYTCEGCSMKYKIIIE